LGQNQKKGGFYINYPTISIILPTYNESSGVKICINSIKNLNYPKNKLEIIAVDDGSQDDTVSNLIKYDIKILKQKHLGCSNARNNGANYASGEILAFLDADDACNENWLIEMINFINIEKVAAVGCSHELLNSKPNDLTMISYLEKSFRHKESPTKTEHIGASGSLINREIFKKIGGFNPKLIAAEDADLCNKIKNLGFDIIIIKKPLIKVEYPSNIISYFKKQIRNSAYHTYFIYTNQAKARGNKYSSILDYVQSIFPLLTIISLYFNNIFLELLFIALILINLKFIFFLMHNRHGLSHFWPLSAMFYLIIRSISWNLGLIYGTILIIRDIFLRGRNNENIHDKSTIY
jgi:cellulose synthase/poly-beta-1,6-N-acetylglucosamine synthase-like glycosyltransferase